MKRIGFKPIIEHDPNEFAKPPRFRLLRRIVVFVLCISMIGLGLWLIRPSLWGVDRWPAGWSMLIASGLVGTGLAVLWTDYIELSDS